MSDKTIDEVTPDADVTGVEKIPVSDGGVPKSVTVNDLNDAFLKRIGELDDETDVNVDSDGVYLKKNGEIKPVAVDKLASAVIAHAFSGESVSDVSKDDEIVIARGGDVKKTTVEAIGNAVKELVGGDIDIASLPVKNVEDLFGMFDEEQFVFYSAPEKSNYKVYLSALVYFINNMLFSISREQTDTDAVKSSYFLIAEKGDDGKYTMKRVRYSNMPIFGIYAVKGPWNTEPDMIPTWDADKLTLKNGFYVANSLVGGGSSTSLPTSIAVYNAVKDCAVIDGIHENGRVVLFGSGKSIKQGPSVATTPSSIGKSDDVMLTEKATLVLINSTIGEALSDAPGAKGEILGAIEDQIEKSATLDGGTIRIAIAGCVSPVNQSQTYGKIPQWAGQGNKLSDGLTVSGKVDSSSTDAQVPTAKAVAYAISEATGGTDSSNVVRAVSTTTEGKIPVWSSTQRQFGYESYAVSKIAGDNRTDSELLTAKATMTAVKQAVKVITYSPSNDSSGFETGQMVYVKSGNYKGLYINLGTTASSLWEKIA